MVIRNVTMCAYHEHIWSPKFVTNIDVTHIMSRSKVQIGHRKSAKVCHRNTKLTSFSQYVECDCRICRLSLSISFPDFIHLVET